MTSSLPTMIDDAAEQRKAEQSLREQQKLVDAIVENIPDMIFVKDARDLRFVRFNRAGEELLGYPREALIGKNDHDFFPKEEADHFTAQDRKVLAEGLVLECPEDRIHTRERGVRILQSKKVPILDDAGQPAYLLGISEDITERKRAEAFRLSDLLVQSMTDYAIFLLDAQGAVKTWNAGAERMTGYTADEIVGRPLAVLRGPAEDGRQDALLAEASSEGRVAEEGPWLRKDGTQIWRVTELTAIRDEQGKVTLFGTVTRDLSERKRAEDEREELLGRLREALRLRDEFLSVASHELRTPVTTLRLQTELLLSLGKRSPEEIGARLPATLEKLVRQVDRLDKHVASLLDVTRLVSGRVELELARADLGEIAETVVARFQEDLRGSPPVRLTASRGIVGVWDALRLDQVLTNLLSNAVKYGLGKPVDVVVSGEEGEARILVHDSGIGVAPADHERIFHQFERAVSERNYGGLGLGLFIVRQIVEAMGGDVMVESGLGEGATFVVRLPYAPRSKDPGH